MIGPTLVAVKKEREIDEDIIWLPPIIASRFRAAVEMPSRRIAGSSIVDVDGDGDFLDDHFPTAMTLGYPRLYRPRRRG
jgi:hypothetical protein